MTSAADADPAVQDSPGITRSGCSGMTMQMPSECSRTMINSPQAGQRVGIAFMIQLSQNVNDGATVLSPPAVRKTVCLTGLHVLAEDLLRWSDLDPS